MDSDITGFIASLTVPDTRRESLELAASLGADLATITTLASALRLSRSNSIVLPARFGHCSKAKGWCRKGSGASAEWGTPDGSGYRVGPGRWIVFSSDGFRREDRASWTVTHVTVGDRVWTIAD